MPTHPLELTQHRRCLGCLAGLTLSFLRFKQGASPNSPTFPLLGKCLFHIQSDSKQV